MGKPFVSFLTACLLVFFTPSALPVFSSTLVSVPRVAIDLEGKFSITDAVWSGGSGSSEIWACWGRFLNSDGAKTDSEASQSLQSCSPTFGSGGVGSRPLGIFDASVVWPGNRILPVTSTDLRIFYLVSRVTVNGQQRWSWSDPSEYTVDYVGQAAEISALRDAYAALHLGPISASVVRSTGDSLLPPRYDIGISHGLNQPIALGLWQGPELIFGGIDFYVCPTVPPRYFVPLEDLGCLEFAGFSPETDGPQSEGLSYQNVSLDYGGFDREAIEQLRKSPHFEIANLDLDQVGPSPRAWIYSIFWNLNIPVTFRPTTRQPSADVAPTIPVEVSPPTSGFAGPLVSRLEAARVKVGKSGILTLHGKRLSSIRAATLGGKSVRLGPTVKNGTKEQRQIFFTAVGRAGLSDLVLETSRGRLTLARAITVLP